jgi:hypothetical protein
MARWLGVLVTAGLVAAPSWAHADAFPHLAPGWYLPVGVNVGVAVQEGGGEGFVLGGEASIVHIDFSTWLWYGAYVDTVGDFGRDSMRLSFGPELGCGPVGFDVGYLGEVRDGAWGHGFQLRIVVSMSLVSLYGRWGRLHGPARENDFGEAGLLFKFPVAVKTEPLAWKRPLPPSDDSQAAQGSGQVDGS